MNARPPSHPRHQTARIVAASGRLRNPHFLLTADHLLLEVDQDSLEIVCAIAEGNVRVHMIEPGTQHEYIVFGRSAKYQPALKRLVLTGWTRTREAGVEQPAISAHREVLLPTDGSFYSNSSFHFGEPPSTGRESGLQAA
jgi:hypothetical protein